MLKLNLSQIIGKDPGAGKHWRQKEKRVIEDEMVDVITDAMDMNLNKLWEMVRDREAWCATAHGVLKSWTWTGGWTTATYPMPSVVYLKFKLNRDPVFLFIKSGNTLATWCKEPAHWKRPWCWERLRARGEEGNKRIDGWMASSTQWTRVWANSRRQWGTGKPGRLRSIGLQKVGPDWATEQQQQPLDENFFPQPRPFNSYAHIKGILSLFLFSSILGFLS